LVFVLSALTCFANPVDITIELPLKLLLPPKLEKGLAILHAFSLLGEFSASMCIKVISLYFTAMRSRLVPAQYSENQVEHEKRSYYYKRHKVDGVEAIPHCVVGLESRKKS